MCQPHPEMAPVASDVPTHVKRRVALAFWVFGLINNFTFVLFLTAAEDILRGYAGVVLLCVVLPGLVCKFAFSVIADRMSFLFRISLVSINSAFWSLVVALAPGVPIKLVALAMYSAVGTLGEMTFLALTANHSEWVVGAYSSGTGAAGIFGAGAYVLLTQTFALSSRMTLLACAGVPLLMIAAFKSIPANTLPPQQRTEQQFQFQHEHLSTEQEQQLLVGAVDPSATTQQPSLKGYQSISDSGKTINLNNSNTNNNNNVTTAKTSSTSGTGATTANQLELSSFSDTTSRYKYVRHLGLLYMLPLATVYFAEYTINSGVMGTLTVFRGGAEAYSVSETYGRYQFLYQIAVFLSRSSISFFRFHHLWVLAALQVVNLVVCVIGSLFALFPSLNFVSALILWEGCLGGLMYVNAFFKLRSEAPPHLRQWALATATIGDSVGTAISAFFSLWLEQAILRARSSAL